MQSTMRTTGPATVQGAALPIARGSPAAALFGRSQSSLLARKAALQPAVQRKSLIVAAAAEATAAASTPTEQSNLDGRGPLDIVFVSAEVAPWSKTGGLGDVVGSLPVELAKRGHRVVSIAPRYDQYWDAWDTSVSMEVDGETVRFFHSFTKGVHRVWIDHPWFLSKVWGQTGAKLYGSKSGADYVDNQKRFSLFCKAAIESLRALPCGPGESSVIVANDWHSALVPVLLKDVYQPRGEFLNTKVAFTVHNIAFQGRFWADSFPDLGLPASSLERFEFSDGFPQVFDELAPAGEVEDEVAAPPGVRFPKLNWLQAGITAADKLITVSPNYATEIASGPELGVELHHAVKAKGVEGIVNGIDVADWSPSTDKFLSFKYNAATVEAGKAYAKAALQKEAGLPLDPTAAVFGFIGRLEEQKGVDILLAALPKLPAGANLQVVVLGTGKKALEAAVKKVETLLPGKAAGVVKFSSPMAHYITAGADYMLVPSRFEPCGLIQLHAMQYGTVPVVASTGGLVDTVKEGVTGLHMGAMDPDDLLQSDAEAMAETMVRAAELYATPAYAAMRDNCIAQDLSWAKPAKKWEAALSEMMYGATEATPEATAQKEAVKTPVVKLETAAAL